MLIERIMNTLEQNGWRASGPEEGWALAVNEPAGRGVAVAMLTENIKLRPPLKHFPHIRNWDTLVLCPDGLDSGLLKNVPPGIQFWFWDLVRGNIFPYPSVRNKRKQEWLVKLAAGQYSGMDPAEKPKIPVFTYIFLAVNILIYILMAFDEVWMKTGNSFGLNQNSISLLLATLVSGSTDPNVLITFGAKVDQLIAAGQIWRLVTSNFIHIGFFHLAFNMYALWAIGPAAEELLGRWGYFGLYILSGIGGTFASFLFTQALSAGASAAIFGLLGALLIFSWRRPQLWRSGLGMNLLVVVLVNLFLGFIIPQIDNFAHLGGLVSGIAVGAVLSKFQEYKRTEL